MVSTREKTNWLWNGVLLLAALAAVVQTVIFFWLPVDGSSGTLESFLPQGYQIFWLPEQQTDGLQNGDVIVKLGEHSIEKWLHGAQAQMVWKEGESITYEVMRGEQTLDVDVALSLLSPKQLIAKSGGEAALAVAMFIFAAYLRWKRSRHLPGRLLMSFMAATALNMWMNVYNIQPAIFSHPGWFWYQLAMERVSYFALFAVLLHLTLVFPRENPLLKRFLKYFVIANYTIGGLVFILVLVFSPSLSQGLQNANQTATVVTAIQLIFVAAAVAYSIFTARDPISAAQIRWFLFGLVGPLVILFFALRTGFVVTDPSLAHHAVFLPLEVGILLLIAFPLTVIVLVPRNYLLEIDTIINRSLVYGTLLFIIGGLYLILQSILPIVIQKIFPGDDQYYYLISLATTFIVLIAFSLLQERVQEAVDRAFYPDKLAYQQSLPEARIQLTADLDLDKLASFLTVKLPRQLRIHQGSLFILDENGEKLTLFGDRLAASLPVNHPLPVHLLQTSKPLLRFFTERTLSSETHAFLHKHGVELCIPLIVNQRLVGIYNLGGKISRAPYTTDEMNLLNSLAQQAAVLVDNARLYREIGVYSQTLEEQVRQRTAELEKALQESHSDRSMAEKASRVKSVFFSNVSHEILTPLNTIMEMTEKLANTRLSEKQHELMNVIQKSSGELNHILNDILDFSILETGRIDLKMQSFQVCECIDAAFSLARQDAEQKGLKLAYVIEAYTPNIIVGDEGRLCQILFTLVNNAIKYTAAGEIIVTVNAESESSAHDKQKDDGCSLHFSIKDTGIGIQKEYMANLFESFTHSNDIDDSQDSNTGLGLAICKKLSEAMGGRIWVESDGIPGMGSTFHFTIFVRPAENSYPAYMGVDQPQLNAKRVLVVDGDVKSSKFLTLFIESWGMILTVEGSGKAALARLNKESQNDRKGFDLVIMDMHLPDMDGITLAEQIHRNVDLKALPLVVMASSGWQKLDARMGEFSASMVKPIKITDLYNLIIRIFAGKFATQAYRALESQEEPAMDGQMANRLPLDILVAEENSSNKRLATLLLNGLGYQVAQVNNGSEVLEALSHKRYDVVLMDIEMSDLDGIETTSRIRGDLSIKLSPHIIAMTSDINRREIKRGKEMGINDFLSKPVQLGQLIIALNQCKPHKKEDQPQTPPSDLKVEPFYESDEEQTDNVPLKTLDEEVLAKFYLSLGLDKEEKVRLLIAQYIKDVKNNIVDARKAFITDKLDRLENEAQKINSSSSRLGVMALAEIAQIIEIRAHEGNLESIDVLLEELDLEFDNAKSLLQSVDLD